jgi:hypothetical protein
LLAGFARQRTQGGKAVIELAREVVKNRFSNRWIAAVTVERELLFLKIFKHVHFEVGTRDHVHHLKYGDDGVLVVNWMLTRCEFRQASKQMFEPEVSAYAFV